MEDNSEKMHRLDFIVTLCLGHGDGGDVCVKADVTDEQYELLKECYREDIEVQDCKGLEDLYDEIKEAAQEENESCLADIGSDEEIDYDSIGYIVQIPNEIADEVNNEEEEIDPDDYYGYPFAMEVVNGEIISMTPDFQEEVIARISEKMGITRKELIERIQVLGNESEDECQELLDLCEYDALVDITGYDECSENFVTEGIGLFDSTYGWEAKELLKELGYKLEENIVYGPHGHGTYGVIYIPKGQT